ncbi:MAG: hypothetical protein LRY73_15075 [Bacillus sp. (in: Bacteria)]|nr:hypothetical protein [Bacillus sp. (in: firmicutes)]
MNDFVSSYVVRIMRTEAVQGEGSYRIKLSHVQSGEEMYVHSFEEMKAYLEEAVAEELSINKLP